MTVCQSSCYGFDIICCQKFLLTHYDLYPFAYIQMYCAGGIFVLKKKLFVLTLLCKSV